MAGILALHTCGIINSESMNQVRLFSEDLSSTRLISVWRNSKGLRGISNMPRSSKSYRSAVESRQAETESPNFGTNGSAVKVQSAATKEALKSTGQVMNGSPVVNGKKTLVNGTSLVKREGAVPVPPVNSERKVKKPKLPPPAEELKVLPSDENFSWANDNYNSWQRSVDVWSFVLSLRVRVLFDNAKWAYPGGFTEEKQVS